MKLLAQPAFTLKPMIEEAMVPSKAVISTYSSSLRKVTSYIASWTGCISMKLLRGYRKRDDAEWVKLYNFCLSKTKIKQAHLYLGAKELAALCIRHQHGHQTGHQQEIFESCSSFVRRQCTGFLKHQIGLDGAGLQHVQEKQFRKQG